MSTTIYYFSGTGNSLKVSKAVKEGLGDANLIQITKDNLSITKDISSDKIGFVFPIYFTGVPLMVKKFVENLEVNKSAYIFAIATFGGTTTIALNQIEDILNKKGASLSAGFTVRMPGNYQVMYDAYSKEVQEERFKVADEQIINIVDSIKKNEQTKVKVNGVKIAFGRLAYKTFKPNNMDKNFWVTEKCNGCSTCSKVCPANNIKMVEGKPEWQHNCEVCLACMQWCPQKSIQYKKNTLKRGRYHHPDIKVNELIQNR
ncbi:EFR1 family ferrodoxin [Clostridium paridis]|uniref:EFR1 family ferrodoxin n=1 Tax=Clostridium paridis TaxID=2803863 RepID=A0A937K620_9CLOT|nr:EFR1 family ferrodoxin [Clostridium paridis]MBL4933223.1 EFR1 family ferrodoxin [Clostridium paridis]